MLDHDWCFVYASKRFTSKVGKEPADFIGKNIWAMFPKHVGTILEEKFRETMDKREVQRFEIGWKIYFRLVQNDCFSLHRGDYSSRNRYYRA